MKSGVWLCFLSLTYGIAIAPQQARSAAFFDPIGNSSLLSKGDEAAAKLNEALASVHLCMPRLNAKTWNGFRIIKERP
jgi:hypothetical protein